MEKRARDLRRCLKMRVMEGTHTADGGRWAVSPRRAEDGGGGGRRHIMVAAVEHRTNFRRKGCLRDNEIPAVATLAQQLGFLPLVGIFIIY